MSHPKPTPPAEKVAESADSAESCYPEAPDPTFGALATRLEQRALVEAMLIIASEPLTEAAAAQALLVTVAEAREILSDLQREYDGGHTVLDARGVAYTTTRRGFQLREIAGGWRFYSRPEFHDHLSAHLLDGATTRLTQAALETLAVVAYRQPVPRARISAIRGVNVDGVMRTLLGRGLIEEQGRDDESKALLYGTTSYFLERLGLTSLDDLAPLAPYLPDSDVLEQIDGELNE
ncbi:SMC-Scp complex subunit ScpB [Micrococcales bacterium 31B]|nr:SMC-Scp complex subunit ScpB [Micrococcales bacterium 31B]